MSEEETNNDQQPEEKQSEDQAPQDQPDKPANEGMDFEALGEKWKAFGIDVLSLIVNTVLLSIISVNFLFYVDPTSKNRNNLNTASLFPYDLTKWPYCYTSLSNMCQDEQCQGFDAPYGVKLEDKDLPAVKKYLIKFMALLNTYMFKTTCVTKDDITDLVKSIKEAQDTGYVGTVVKLGNASFRKIRFKQWLANSFIFSNMYPRKMTSLIMDKISGLIQAIPEKWKPYLFPMLVLLGPLGAIGYVFYFAMFIPLLLELLGMVLNYDNKTQRFEWGGGLVWTLVMTALGGFTLFMGFMVWVVQLIEGFIYLFIYPLTHWDEYQNLYAKFIPVIFFVFNLGVLSLAFNHLPLDIAAPLIAILFALYINEYWNSIQGFMKTMF